MLIPIRESFSRQKLLRSMAAFEGNGSCQDMASAISEARKDGGLSRGANLTVNARELLERMIPELRR
ncbi:MAG: hypothetical protein DMG87_20235 [Acidobacteria bacterium]|jgi:hypothetical protein|nr:MAG: hypothetical protein DMG87_20235 [Acidobacteriota bacterium]